MPHQPTILVNKTLFSIINSLIQLIKRQYCPPFTRTQNKHTKENENYYQKDVDLNKILIDNQSQQGG